MQVIRLGFAPDYVDYQRAWDLQRDLHAKVVSSEVARWKPARGTRPVL